MRDAILIFLLPILMYYAIKRPFIGLSLWLWSSLVPMQTWSFGIATTIRWNMIFALCTMLGYLFQPDKPKFLFNKIFGLYLLFVVWVSIASFMHSGYDDHVFRQYDRFIKASLFFLFAALIVEKEHHLEALIWALVLSVGLMAGTQGVAVIVSAGGHKPLGISNAFNDNNLAALATLMTLPFLIYLFFKYRHQKLLKYALLAGMTSNLAFVIGSDSRGAFLGLIVLVGYFFLKSDKKALVSVFLIAGGLLGFFLVDQAWTDRMGTMSELGSDNSFQGRLVAWKLHLLMALESPLFGGGFDAASYGPTVQYLLMDWDKVSFIPSADPGELHVAHSIYFQILGDNGFGGFFIYILMLAVLLSSLKSLKKKVVNERVNSMAMYTGLSVMAFLVSGAALSAAYNEIILMLLAFQVGLSRFYMRELEKKQNVKKLLNKSTIRTL